MLVQLHLPSCAADFAAKLSNAMVTFEMKQQVIFAKEYFANPAQVG